MKLFQIYQVAYILCISINDSYPSLIKIQSKSFGKNVITFLNNFQTCHIKYFVGNMKNNDAFVDISLLTVKHLKYQVSVSTNVLYNLNNTHNTKSHHYWGKFTSCFIHWYMVDQLELYQEPRHILRRMRNSEMLGELPDYFIFYEDHNTYDSIKNHVNITIFYRKILPLLYLMGPVFRIDSL